MVDVLLLAAVECDDVVNDLAKILHACKCFIHASVIVLADQGDSIGCTQEFEATEGGDERGELLAFLVEGALVISL